MNSIRIIVHADNHIHDGMKCVVSNLLNAAQEGKVILFCEGSPHLPNIRCNKTVRAHGIEWEGESPFIHGIEEPLVDSMMLWANASQLAFRTGRDDNRCIKHAGKEGVLAVRAIIVAIAAVKCADGTFADDNMDHILSTYEDLSLFLSKFCDPVSEAYDESCSRWRECDLYAAADRLANDVGRWPAGDMTFKDLQGVCLGMMEALGLDSLQHESIDEYIDYQHMVVREERIAQNITTTLGRLHEEGLLADRDVHLIIGAGHVPQLVDDSTLRLLMLDTECFWGQQKHISANGKRLCDLLNCRLSDDPFDAEVSY